MNHTLRVTKYQMHDAGKAMLRYYLIITMVWIFLGVLVNVWLHNSGNDAKMGGLETSTVVFVFIAGLNCFKANYKFMSANGVSRKRFFRGNMLSLLGIAGLATIIDTVLAFVFRSFMNYHQTYEQLYRNTNVFNGMVWLFFIYTAAITLGWLITMLYYRSGKQLKLVISFAPAVLLIGLGVLNGLVGGSIFSAIVRFTVGFWGLKSMNSYVAALNLSLFTALLGTFIFLLVRKAPIKN